VAGIGKYVGLTAGKGAKRGNDYGRKDCTREESSCGEEMAAEKDFDGRRQKDRIGHPMSGYFMAAFWLL